jgi:hypothetical protein
MAKAIDDLGHLVQINKPLALRVYDPGRLPCPVQNANALITVNNRADGDSLCPMISDGSRWRRLKFADENDSVAVQHDITALVREAVASVLPTIPSIKVIEHAKQPFQSVLPDMTNLDELREAIRDLASANLEIGQHLSVVLREHAELRAELEAIKQTPVLADIRLAGAA